MILNVTFSGDKDQNQLTTSSETIGQKQTPRDIANSFLLFTLNEHA